MPYFKCKGCALRWYSAASQTRCAECGMPLGVDEQAQDATPLAEPQGSLPPFAPAEPLATTRSA